MMRVGYIAHQLGAPTVAEMEANRKNAELWLAWIAYHFDVAPVASSEEGGFDAERCLSELETAK